MSDNKQYFSLRKIAVAAFGPSLLFGIGQGAIYPIIALSAKSLGTSSAMAGFIVALLGIGSLLTNIPAAALAARIGERWAMVCASAFALLAVAFCLLAQEPILFATGVFMVGMASAVFKLARQTYLVEAVPLTMRARAMSTLGGTVRIGLFAGPFIAAIFIKALDLAGAYWAASIAIIGAGLLCLLMPDLPGNRKQRASAQRQPTLEMMHQHKHAFITIGVATALVAALRACRQIVIPLWADDIGLDAATTALIYGLMGSIDMLLFYPAGKIMDIKGRLWIAMPSMLIMSCCLLLMPLTTGFVSLLIVSMVLGFGNGIGSGIVMTIGADASPRTGRTQFLGIWRTITDIGGGSGPLLLSAITATISLVAGIISIASLGFIAAYMFWRWLPRKITE